MIIHKIEHLIIGGGITALTLAYRLQLAAKNFCLFEPGQLGGMIRSEINSGFILETGPNVLLLRPALLELLKELDLSSEITYPKIPKFQQLVWNEQEQQLQAVPKGPKAFLLNKAFSSSEKITIVKKLFSKRLIPSDLQDISIGELLRKLGSKVLVDCYADAALKGIYGGDIYKLSARTIMPNLWKHLLTGESLASFVFKSKPAGIAMLRSGNQILVDTLVKKISPECIINTAVTELTVNEANDFPFNVRLANGEIYQAKKVYVTTAGVATVSFLGAEFDQLKQALNSLEFASLALVHLAIDYNAVLPKDAFGFLIPGNNEDGFLGTMFNSQLFPHLAPLNRQLLTVCIGGAGRADLMDLPKDQIEALIANNLHRILGLKSFELLKITCWRKAIPQLQVGHFQINSLFTSFENQFSGLNFIGNDRGGVGVSERIKLGMSCEVL